MTFMSSGRASLRKLGFLAVLLVSQREAGALDLVILASSALQPAFQALAPAFEMQTGHRLEFRWGASTGTASGSLPSRMQAEYFDAAVMLEEPLDSQIEQGRLMAGSKALLASSRLGMAVRPGVTPPKLEAPGSVCRALLGAASIGVSNGVSGAYVVDALLPRLGIAREVRSRLVVVAAPELVGHAVMSGEVEMGLQQMSELLAVPGLQVVGPLPEAMQRVNFIAGAIASESRNAEAASAWLAYLGSSDARSRFQVAGFDPVGKRGGTTDSEPLQTCRALMR